MFDDGCTKYMCQESRIDKLEPFRLFRQKAEKLLSSTFASEMAKPTGVDINWTEDGHIAVHRGPSQESIDAYILTFRFFIQGNESISFIKMGDNFRTKINDEALFRKFEEVREALNKYLDADSHFNVNGIVSHRHLMEVFIFGDLSHANIAGKRDTYMSWMKDEIMAELMKYQFKLIIGKALIAIDRVDKLCKEAIEKHSHDYAQKKHP